MFLLDNDSADTMVITIPWIFFSEYRRANKQMIFNSYTVKEVQIETYLADVISPSWQYFFKHRVNVPWNFNTSQLTMYMTDTRKNTKWNQIKFENWPPKKVLATLLLKDQIVDSIEDHIYLIHLWIIKNYL